MSSKKNSPKILPIAGPWQTKSGGQLSVLFNFDTKEAGAFVKGSSHLSGLRAYRVTGLRKGEVGAREWHKFRTEMAFVTRGKVTWKIVDSEGIISSVVSEADTNGIAIAPGLLHTYQVEVDDTELLVLANTLFDPDDSSTHDTYHEEDFGA